ncbi:MAG: DUF4321 domain-containing protein [Clostridia bacterium]|nr:DUF4321 domain-containing protein [Clostridia bacterium]
MRTNFWITLLLICAGIVIGSLVAELTAGIPVLGWLAYGLDFGTQSPFTLDLHVLILTFGATVRITIAHILCICLTLIVGRAVIRR